MNSPMILDRDLRPLAVLDGAFSVGYDMRHQELWTGSFSLGREDPANAACQMLRYVRIWDGEHEVGLFRLIGMPSGAEREGGAMTYATEHVLAVLLDDLVFGSATIRGTLSEVIGWILEHQTTARWVLGDVEIDESISLELENETLLGAVQQACAQLRTEWVWDFDTTRVPWVLHIRRADQNDGCGIHYGRNLVGIDKTIDASGMFTRLYLRGAGGVNVRDLTGGVDYIDEGVEKWGVKCGVYDDPNCGTSELLLERGRILLGAYCEPYVTYTATALDLFALTGQEWDRCMPGRMVRVMDDEHGISFSARVVSVAKSDVHGDPGSVVITIANKPLDVLDELTAIDSGMESVEQEIKKTDDKVEKQKGVMATQNELLTKHGSAIGEQKFELDQQKKALEDQKKALEDQKKDLEDQQKELEEQKTTLDGQMTKLNGIESRMQDAEGNVSLLKQTATDITARVLGAEGDVAQLKVTATAITGRVNDAEGNIGALQVTAQDVTARVSTAEGNIGQLQVTATSIEGRVENAEGDVAQLKLTAEGLRTDVNKKVDDTVYQSYIQQTATEISAKVSAGDIASAFSMTAGNITLFSKTINLDGYVEAKAISALEGNFDRLMGGDVSYGTLSGGMLYPTGISADGDVFGESLSTSGTISCQGTNFSPHTLTVGGSSWTILGDSDINFKIADTQEYKDGVSAAEEKGKASVGLSDVTVEYSWNANYHVYNYTGKCEADNGVKKAVMSSFEPTEAVSYGWDVGHTAGYNEGVASVDTDAYYKSGFDAGRKDVGLGNVSVTHTWSSTYHVYSYTGTCQADNGVKKEVMSSFTPTEAISYGWDVGHTAGVNEGYTAGKDSVTCTSVDYEYEAGGRTYVLVNLSNGKSVRKSY